MPANTQPMTPIGPFRLKSSRVVASDYLSVVPGALSDIERSVAGLLGLDLNTDYAVNGPGDTPVCPASMGVDGGDAHNHDGVHTAKIDHNNLLNAGLYTHAQIDAHINNQRPHHGHESLISRNVPGGYVGLDGLGKVPSSVIPAGYFTGTAVVCCLADLYTSSEIYYQGDGVTFHKMTNGGINTYHGYDFSISTVSTGGFSTYALFIPRGQAFHFTFEYYLLSSANIGDYAYAFVAAFGKTNIRYGTRLFLSESGSQNIYIGSGSVIFAHNIGLSGMPNAIIFGYQPEFTGSVLWFWAKIAASRVTSVG